MHRMPPIDKLQRIVLVLMVTVALVQIGILVLG
jgi:hypothetical protein